MYLVRSGRPAGPNFSRSFHIRSTVEYLLNSSFGRLCHAKMKKRSKLLNPRAAAWLKWPGTGLAGMGPTKYPGICNQLPKICNYKQRYGQFTILHLHMQKYARNFGHWSRQWCSCIQAGRVASIYCDCNRAGNARGPGLNNRHRRPGFRHRRRDSEYPAPARPNCSIVSSCESRV